MDAYECFHLDISKILELIEPNELLLCTWSYFQHCQQTAQKLEKEAWFQKDLAESLLGELQTLKIDEILWPVIIKARWEEQRLMQYAWPPSSICIMTPTDMSITQPDNPIPDTSLSTFTGGLVSPLSHAGGPSQPMVIVDEDTTPPPSNAYCRHHHHGHRYHHQEREKDHPFINWQVVMYDTWQQVYWIWDLWSRKGVMLWSCYLIIIQTTFSLQCNSACFLHHFYLSLRIVPSMHF